MTTSDKLLSKEEQRIRENAFKMSGSMGTDALDYVWPEIKEMTKNTAISFAEWINSEGYRIHDKVFNTWENDSDIEIEYPTSELYQLYLKSLK